MRVICALYHQPSIASPTRPGPAITLSGAPTGGRPLKSPHCKSNSAQNHNQRTCTHHTVGVWGRPSRRAAARSPHPTFCPHLSGARGGWPHRGGGRRFRGASPFQPAPKIPGTGRRRPPRKRLLCATTTPSAVPLVGFCPAGFCGCRWRQGEGVAPPMS